MRRLEGFPSAHNFARPSHSTTMFRLTRTFARATAPAFTPARSLSTTPFLRNGTSPISNPSKAATKQQHPSSTKESNSPETSPKEAKQKSEAADQAQADASAPEAEANASTYGTGEAKEGVFPKGSKGEKERKEAGKQGTN
ncbi:hypothetical protein BCR35DRAFT_326545 [Leucosporidium creatinivorum]|uniref:Uncharacterized protein n=1 Tax=Leucosporidium creatinivorum TaxID=106004 RepID=A0A1Y2E511_9BASI|nr:hypothetical protein BCR35DRAFT_326545 [Leucosporidium creatinivorum]